MMAGTSKTTSKTTSKKDEVKGDPLGANIFANGFEQIFGGYGDMAAFGRENIEAFVESANLAKTGLETLQSEALAFSKQSIEDTTAIAQAAIKARSVQELVEIQSDFAKTAFDAYLGQVNKWTDLVNTAAKGAFEPLNGRVNAFIEKTQG